MFGLTMAVLHLTEFACTDFTPLLCIVGGLEEYRI